MEGLCCAARARRLLGGPRLHGLGRALLGKTDPVDTRRLVAMVAREEVDDFHPLVTLLQGYLDEADPLHVARGFFREPAAGRAPRSVYVSLGLQDRYAPTSSTKALALALGVAPVNPRSEPIEGLDLTDLVWRDPPIGRNVASQAATGVVCEYAVPRSFAGAQAYDGALVTSRDADAARQAAAFLGTHSASGIARLIK